MEITAAEKETKEKLKNAVRALREAINEAARSGIGIQLRVEPVISLSENPMETPVLIVERIYKVL